MIGCFTAALLNLGTTRAWSQPAAPADAPPAQTSPLLVEPKTPEGVYDAIVLLIDLGRPVLARTYLDKLMAMGPDDDAILKMRDKHGPASFLKLANIKELQPVSIELLDRMNASFRKWATDPQRVDEMIAQLGGTAQEREIAVLQLRSAGPVVIPRLLATLHDPQQREQRATLLYALTRLGRQVIPALIGALETPDPELRATVIDALGWIGGSDVAPYLWYSAFGSDQPAGVQAAAQAALERILQLPPGKSVGTTAFGAAERLKAVALEHFRGEYQWPAAEDGTVAVWFWSIEDDALTSNALAPRQASQYAGSRLTRQALVLSPQDVELQALYLAFRLAGETRLSETGLEIPTNPDSAFNLALTVGADVLNRTLSLSLENANVPPAWGALRALAQTSPRQQLYGADRRRAPVIAALSYPDRRIQFAAAVTVLELAPDRPFAGADRVVDILVRALTSDGQARGVVVDANEQRAGTMGGILREMGFDPLVAPTGQEGFRLAAERGDVELVVLHANTLRWPLSQTLANLRADSRTAAIPVIVFGSNDLRNAVERQLLRYPLTMFAVESASTDAFNTQVRPFLDRLQTRPLSQQEQVIRLRTAAYWLANLAADKSSVFNITPAEQALFSAVDDPEAARDALVGLGGIATAGAQTRLAEIAVNATHDVEIRETAAIQLAFHIQRFGLLLPMPQIADLRTIWIAADDPQLKLALASVVGSFKPDAAKVSERLQKFQPPALRQAPAPAATPTPMP